ncbi:MAG: trypsin-like serine protease [Bacteriovoracaceae bacterium]|nr:trypsin-like serine protease [Bacteriovoracaceae bacterium]
MRKWFFIWIVIPVFAHAFIGGGGKISFEQYPFVQKMDFPKSGDCSLTMLSPLWIITAAHCVTADIVEPETNVKRFKVTLEAGMMLTPLGIVEKVDVHPDYITNSEEITRLYNIKLNRELNPIEKQAIGFYHDNATGADLAIIKLKENIMPELPSEYPKIPSPGSAFSDEEMNLVGFGAMEREWSQDEKGEYGMHTKELMMRNQKSAGTSNWACVQKAPNITIKNFADNMRRHLPYLQNSSDVTHHIRSPMETSTATSAYALPGDSGSPALEKLTNGELVISAVAATMKTSFDDNFVLAIENRETKEIKRINIYPPPKNWGDAKLRDTEFPEILKHFGGTIPENVILYREYQEKITNHYTNLLYPANYNFLKQKLKANPELFTANPVQK